jgi:DNA-binding NarL/FixJ family response regulator
MGIVVLSRYLEAHVAMRRLDGGACGVGYLLKDRVIAGADFVASVRRVAAGGVAVDPEVVALLMHPRPKAGPLDELTQRERSVLALMAEGRSDTAIGRALFIAPKTVQSAVRSIFLRLGLPEAPDDHRRVLAVITYLENR